MTDLKCAMFSLALIFGVLLYEAHSLGVDLALVAQRIQELVQALHLV